MNLKIEHFSHIPKYIQLRGLLEKKILAGDFNVGEKFFTEHELMKKYKLSSATVARTMKELVTEGYITRKRGNGSFIKSKHKRLPVKTSCEHVPLLINGISAQTDPIINPLNWFIIYEIHRGITNSYTGNVRILENDDMINEIKSDPESSRRIIFINPTDEYLQCLSRKNVAYIVINQAGKTAISRNAVNWDQLTGVYEGISYLINDLGHRSIALIAGNMVPHQDRIAGYQISLRTFNIRLRDEWMITSAGGTENDGYEAMKSLLKLKSKPSAVFVDTDIKALGAIRAVQDCGLKVPEDISILGYDDIPGIQNIDPPLTTIRGPYYEMGVKAVALLNKRLKSANEDVASSTIKSKLVIRESCLKPAN